jgi:hypothetical protein
MRGLRRGMTLIEADSRHASAPLALGLQSGADEVHLSQLPDEAVWLRCHREGALGRGHLESCLGAQGLADFTVSIPPRWPA